MKSLITVYIVLFSTQIFCQWKTKSGGNKFDGSYKTATVIGKGGEFPYASPMFVINSFEKGEPNIYITKIGYTGCNRNIIKIAFDGEDEVYTSYGTSTNDDNDALFINSIENLTIIDFLEKLKTKSKLFIRFSSSCGQNDYTFGLSGSTKAINFVVNDFFSAVLESINKSNAAKKDFEQRYIDFIESFECGKELPFDKPILTYQNTSSVTWFNLSDKRTQSYEGDFIAIFDVFIEDKVYIQIRDEISDTKPKKAGLISLKDLNKFTLDSKVQSMFHFLPQIEYLKSQCE